jgi:hypothetical protein
MLKGDPKGKMRVSLVADKAAFAETIREFCQRDDVTTFAPDPEDPQSQELQVISDSIFDEFRQSDWATREVRIPTVRKTVTFKS